MKQYFGIDNGLISSVGSWGSHILRGRYRNQETWLLILGVGVGRDSEPGLCLLPFPRWASENGFDPATLTNKEMRLLLAAMMNDYVQMKACELKQETGGLQVKALPSAQHLPSPLAYQEDVS